MGDYIIAIFNIMVSGSIFILFICYRGRLFEQNKVERIGLNIMAISAFIICIKTTANLLFGSPSFDVYGMMFRIGYLLYLASNIYTSHTEGVAVAVKKPMVHVFASQCPDSVKEPSRQVLVAAK